MFQKLHFPVFLSPTHGDNQVGQTLLIHSAAGGEGELQDYVLLPTLGCLGVLGRFCTLGCSHIGSPSFSPTKGEGSQGTQLSLKTHHF